MSTSKNTGTEMSTELNSLLRLGCSERLSFATCISGSRNDGKQKGSPPPGASSSLSSYSSPSTVVTQNPGATQFSDLVSNPNSTPLTRGALATELRQSERLASSDPLLPLGTHGTFHISSLKW